jgi:hypothetical protein
VCANHCSILNVVESEIIGRMLKFQVESLVRVKPIAIRRASGTVVAVIGWGYGA